MIGMSGLRMRLILTSGDWRSIMCAMRIVQAGQHEYGQIMTVEHDAFGRDDEPRLVSALLSDPTAQPSLSLLAYEGTRAVGQVLFTRATLLGATRECSAVVLTPLAMIPDFQRKGVGRALIEQGCECLTGSGMEPVFVLGDPGYYSRCGFQAALPHGLLPPYPVVPQAAWMMDACADAMRARRRPGHGGVRSVARSRGVRAGVGRTRPDAVA